jgi:hypothetical protein
MGLKRAGVTASPLFTYKGERKMKIIQKTMIENLLHSRRKFAWAGQHGKVIDADSSVIIDGAFPSACTRKGQAQQMQSDIDNGFCKVTMVTNLPTMKPLETEGRQVPEAVKKANKVEKTTAPQKVKVEKNDRFAKGGIDEIHKNLTEQATLPGADALPEMPETVEIFKDGGQPIGEEMVKKPDHIKQVKAPEGTTQPEGGDEHLLIKHEVEEKAPAKKPAANKPAAKKTTTRRKSTAKKDSSTDK